MNMTASWNEISKQPGLSENFIREHEKNLDWITLCYKQKLSENLIREMKPYIKWDIISETQTLSEPFMREYKDILHWDNICSFQKLSESFIEDMSSYVNWIIISRTQTLSEPFIEKHLPSLHWDNIIQHQPLSLHFLRKYIHNINFSHVEKNDFLSQIEISEFKNEYFHYWKSNFSVEYIAAQKNFNKIKHEFLIHIHAKHLFKFKESTCTLLLTIEGINPTLPIKHINYYFQNELPDENVFFSFQMTTIFHYFINHALIEKGIIYTALPMYNPNDNLPF